MIQIVLFKLFFTLSKTIYIFRYGEHRGMLREDAMMEYLKIAQEWPMIVLFIAHSVLYLYIYIRLFYPLN